MGIQIAGNYIGVGFWHAQLLFNNLELEVQSPRPGLFWTYERRSHDGFTNGDPNTPYLGEDGYYETSQVSFASSDQYAWQSLNNVFNQFADQSILYNAVQNSNSFVKSMLWVVGSDYPLSTVQYPGFATNIFLNQHNAFELDLYGTKDTDHYRGGLRDDILRGSDTDGVDDRMGDILEAGEGEDAYYVGSGDIIRDSDGLGAVFIEVWKNAPDFGGGWNWGEFGLGEPGGYWDEWNEGDPRYMYSVGGSRFTDEAGREYVLSGNGLRVTYADGVYEGRINQFYIADWSDGDLGLSIGTLPEPENINSLPQETSAETHTPSHFSGVADYSAATGEVGVSLVFGGFSGLADGDTYSNVTTIIGSAFDDWLFGDRYNSRVLGGVGDDVLRGEGGVDVLIGGIGNDTFFGGEGDDVLYVDGDDQTISGGAGYDRLFADAGSGGLFINMALAEIEYARGSESDDFFDAEFVTQAVKIWGNGGDDELSGSGFGDYINGGSGDDGLYGLAGDDILIGFSGEDVFEAGAGNDILFIDAQDREIDGGADYDRVYVASYSTGVNVDMTTGNLEFASGSTFGDVFDATGAGWSVLLLGQAGGDQLTGGDFADQLFGGEGGDSIAGNGGADIISGGSGADQLSGGAGDDTLLVDADDTSINGGAGYDRVYVDASSTGVLLNLTTSLVEFAFGGDGDDEFSAAGSTVSVKLLGNGGNDFLIGGSMGDLVYGGDGMDILIGLEGDDFLSGGGADGAMDTFVFDEVWGHDTIADFQNGEDLLSFSPLGIAFADLNIAALGANNAVVSYGADSVTLLGIQISDLDASDFAFV